MQRTEHPEEMRNVSLNGDQLVGDQYNNPMRDLQPSAGPEVLLPLGFHTTALPAPPERAPRRDRSSICISILCVLLANTMGSLFSQSHCRTRTNHASEQLKVSWRNLSSKVKVDKGYVPHVTLSSILHSCWAKALMQQMGRCSNRAGAVWVTQTAWFKGQSLLHETGTKKSSSSRYFKSVRSCPPFSLSSRHPAGGSLALSTDKGLCPTNKQAQKEAISRLVKLGVGRVASSTLFP